VAARPRPELKEPGNHGRSAPKLTALGLKVETVPRRLRWIAQRRGARSTADGPKLLSSETRAHLHCYRLKHAPISFCEFAAMQVLKEL
jgi:hypothetical protein